MTIKGLKKLTYEKKLRVLDLFSLEKRRLRGALNTVFQCIKHCCKEDKDSFFKRATHRRQEAMGTSHTRSDVSI